MHRQFKWFVIAATIVASTGWSLFEDKPSEKDILPAVIAAAPKSIEVKGLAIAAQSNQGTDTRPSYETRFSAEATIREDLFVRVDAIGVRDIVAKTREKGTELTIFGFANSTKSKEQWETKAQLEQIEIGGEEKFLSAFRLPILQGSSEESEAIDAERQRVDAEAAKATKQREEQARAAQAEREANEQRARDAQEKIEQDRKNAFARTAEALTGKWAGQFRCGSNLFVSSLKTVTDASGNFTIEHSWAPAMSGSEANRGAGVLVGGFKANGEFSTSPSHWLIQPKGIILVGLSGSVAQDGRTLYLKPAQGCSPFEARRAG
ncbi:hypothetical protein [Agrobacterium tumefaciens]|uniref:hypothetical protein n=1 Tax=Agrobacterium tumefaciens TaxID=358 RepID=UPI00054D8583|nr:hypothetical protein [Agrobacterium tumefaciens]